MPMKLLSVAFVRAGGSKARQWVACSADSTSTASLCAVNANARSASTEQMVSSHDALCMAGMILIQG